MQSSHTFNLKTGEEYKLKDLVKSGADYVSFISGSVRDEINKRSKEEGLLEITPFEAIRDDQDFTCPITRSWFTSSSTNTGPMPPAYRSSD